MYGKLALILLTLTLSSCGSTGLFYDDPEKPEPAGAAYLDDSDRTLMEGKEKARNREIAEGISRRLEQIEYERGVEAGRKYLLDQLRAGGKITKDGVLHTKDGLFYVPPRYADIYFPPVTINGSASYPGTRKVLESPDTVIDAGTFKELLKTEKDVHSD